jgi:hypothetical protein
MAGRSTDDVKREIESERERLGDAVKKLRSQADTARRKLPLVALGAAGAGLIARTLRKRVSRQPAGTDGGGRFSFLRR